MYSVNNLPIAQYWHIPVVVIFLVCCCQLVFFYWQPEDARMRREYSCSGYGVIFEAGHYFKNVEDGTLSNSGDTQRKK